MSDIRTDFDIMYARRLAIAEGAGMDTTPILSAAEARQLLDAYGDSQRRIAELEAKIEEAKRLMEIAVPTLLTVSRDSPMPSDRQLPVLIRQMQGWLGWPEQAAD